MPAKKNGHLKPEITAKGLDFPCIIDIKVFMQNADDNLQLVRGLLLQSIAQVCLLSISQKHSKHNKYQAFSCKIHALNQMQMDELFRQLTSHPQILLVI